MHRASREIIAKEGALCSQRAFCGVVGAARLTPKRDILDGKREEKRIERGAISFVPPHSLFEIGIPLRCGATTALG